MEVECGIKGSSKGDFDAVPVETVDGRVSSRAPGIVGDFVGEGDVDVVEDGCTTSRAVGVLTGGTDALVPWLANA